MFIVFDLSPEAIAALNALAKEKGVTRSEFVNNQIISIKLPQPAYAEVGDFSSPKT